MSFRLFGPHRKGSSASLIVQRFLTPHAVVILSPQELLLEQRYSKLYRFLVRRWCSWRFRNIYMDRGFFSTKIISTIQNVINSAFDPIGWHSARVRQGAE
jgi:hypothetical protein